MAVFQFHPLDHLGAIGAAQERLRQAHGFDGLGKQGGDDPGERGVEVALGDDMAGNPQREGLLGAEWVAEQDVARGGAAGPTGAA